MPTSGDVVRIDVDTLRGGSWKVRAGLFRLEDRKHGALSNEGDGK